MAQRDRPAVDIEPGVVGTQMLCPRHRHRREGFVDLVEIDVTDLHAGAGQRLLCGEQRLFQHHHRVAAGHRHLHDAGQRREVVLLHRPFRGDHHRGGAIGDLTGGGGGDGAAFHQQLNIGHALGRDVPADALVHRVHGGASGGFDGQRQNLGGKGAIARGALGAVLAFQAEGVEHLAGEAPFARDHLGPAKLAETLDTEAPLDGVGGYVQPGNGIGRGAHGHPRHALGPGGDHQIHSAGHDCLCGELHRLLRGAALAIHRYRRHSLRQRGGQHRVASDVVGLFGGLRDAAEDDVLDAVAGNSGTGDHLVQNRRTQIDRVPTGKPAITPPASGARCCHNIGLGHVFPLPCSA